MFLLTREREARGWSRNELARRARMAAGDVGRIEAGRLRPYGGQLKKLAKALGWPVDEAQRLLEVTETIENSSGGEMRGDTERVLAIAPSSERGGR